MGIETWDPSYVSDQAPVVIGGCGRPGTTLTRVLLDSHPSICCGPESALFLPKAPKLDVLASKFDMTTDVVDDLVRRAAGRQEFIDMFLSRYAELSGKPRWAEKTPRNVLRLDELFRHWPKAVFVHVVRNSCDVVASLRTHPRHKVVDGELVPVHTRRPLDECIDRWLSDTGAALPWRQDPRYHEVRYEDLVQSTEPTMRRLLSFVGEPWDASVLAHHAIDGPTRDVVKFPQNPEAVRPITGERVGRAESDLSAEERNHVLQRTAARLVELDLPVA